MLRDERMIVIIGSFALLCFLVMWGMNANSKDLPEILPVIKDITLVVLGGVFGVVGTKISYRGSGKGSD